MKTTLLIPLLALACATSLRAQNVAGTQLEIGPVGSNQVSDSPSIVGGAIGQSNSVQTSYSLAVGFNNLVNAYGAIAIGSNHHVGPYGGAHSLCVGFQNWMQGDYSGAIGIANTLTADGDESQGSGYSLLVGYVNYSEGKGTFAVGQNNVITGDSGAEGHTSFSAVVGSGLICDWSNSLIVGRYNDNGMPKLSGLLFAIGNGVDSAHRSNVWEVYADGKIKMPRQGDILMGEFGNGD